MNAEDGTLLRRAQEGDEEAFRLLVARHESRLRGVIFARLTPALRRKVGASDILQEAHLVAAQRLKEFESRGQGSFGQWLSRIVELKLRETVRHYNGTSRRDPGREVTRTQRPDTGCFSGREAEPIDAAIAAELQERMQAALKLLNPEHREVLRLLHEQQQSLDEAARRLGRSRGAVQKHYERALARLAGLLEEPS